MNHSPEPWTEHNHPTPNGWHHGFRSIHDANGMNVAVVNASTVYGEPLSPGPENAQRIVACVNHCYGIPTEKLGWKPFNSAPKDGTTILAYRPRSNGTNLHICLFNGTLWTLADSQKPIQARSLTHWMPLPTTPTVSHTITPVPPRTDSPISYPP